MGTGTGPLGITLGAMLLLLLEPLCLTAELLRERPKLPLPRLPPLWLWPCAYAGYMPMEGGYC